MSNEAAKLKKSPRINRRYRISKSESDPASETEFVLARDKKTGKRVVLHYDSGIYGEDDPSNIVANELKVLTVLNGLSDLGGSKNPHVQRLVDVIDFSGTTIPVVEWPVFKLINHSPGDTLEQIFRDRLEFYDESEIPGEFREWVTSLTPEKIVEGVCDALGYMHEHGVYHNWVKPTSIGLFEDNTVKLMHFGYAGGAKKEMPFRSSRYFPPELRDEGSEFTPHSDLYMLASAMFKFLSAGTLPFDNKGSKSDKARDIVAVRIEVDKLDVSNKLKGAMVRCLAPNPQERYQSAYELKQELTE